MLSWIFISVDDMYSSFFFPPEFVLVVDVEKEKKKPRLDETVA